MHFEVVFYETLDGKEPAKDFLLALAPKMRAKVVRTICLLREYGNSLREPYSKYLRDNIFELRTKTGTDDSRILYFFFSGQKIVLTNGFIKKSQKTPLKEIQKAIVYRNDYMRRMKEHEQV